MDTRDKAAWRRRIRSARGQESAAEALETGTGLARTGLAWLNADDGGSPPAAVADGAAKGAVCAYISMGSEPPTGQLLAALCHSGRTVYVPVCEADFQLSWVRWTPEVPLAASTLAPVMEPLGSRINYEQLGSVTALLIPALAVDASGVRLGQGGGYYDRFLSSLDRGPARSVAVAAVVRDSEVLPEGTLPHDELDIPVRHILTPSGHRSLDQI